MKKRWMAVILAGFLAMGSLTGCGSQEQTESEGGSDVPATAEETAEAPVSEADVSTGDNDAVNAEAFGIDLNLNLDDALQGQYAGQEITVFCCTGEFSEPLQESIDAFEQLSGAKVNLYVYSFDELNTKISLAFTGDEDMDVCCFVSAYMETYNSLGQLADLTELSEQYGAPSYNWDGFAEALISRTSDEDGVYAVPYQICEMMDFYRKDLLESPEVQAQYLEATGKELSLPTTPEELAEIASFFTQSQNPDSPTTYGYIEQGITNALLWSWMGKLGYYGGDMFGDDWSVQFNNEAGEKAMEWGKSMLVSQPDNWNELGFDEINTLMASGEAFICENWSSAYPSLNTGEMEGKIGCMVTAGDSPVLSGWSLGINALSEKQELAWKFIEFCTSEDGELTRVDNGVAPARDINMQRVVEAGEDSGFYEALAESMRREKTVWGDVCLPYLGSQGTSIIDTYTQSVYKGEMEVKDGLNAMQADIEAAMASVQ